MYSYRCEDCGAYLDPGESCDCKHQATLENKEATMPASTAANPQKGESL